MYKDHTVAVVVPAYDEAGFVGETIDTIPAFVDRVYAVDDCSTDGTWEEIRRHARRINEESEPAPVHSDGTEKFSRRVIPIKHEENRGVGGAIKTGYRRAHADGMDVTAVMNGDGQMDPDILDRIVDPVVEGRADYVKGNRLLYPEYREEMSTWRFFGNSVLSLLTNAASGYWKLSDPQNGYTAISHRAIGALDLDALYDRYGFLNHLLYHLNLREFRVTDVAMAASYGEETSTIRYATFVPTVSALLARCFLRRLTVKYLVFDFHPLVALYALGAAGVATSLAGLVGLGWQGGVGPVGGLLALLVFLVGALSLTLATVYDMRQSEQLEEQRYGLVPDEASDPTPVPSEETARPPRR